jgi:tight adherence protein B
MSEYVDQIAGLIGGLSVLLAFGGYVVVLQRRRLDARLAVFVGGQPLQVAPSVPRKARSLSDWLFWRRLRIGVTPQQLTQAGVSVTPRAFLFLQLAAGWLGLACAWLLAGRIGLAGVGVAVALAIGGLLGLLGPRGVLRFKRSRRLARFEGQFASALDSVANAMEVGLSLSQALETVSRDMPAPIGPEFGQVVRELGMGLPVGEALDGLVERVPLRDVEIFVAAVHIQYRTGGALSEVLRTIAATVRQRVNLRAEIRSMTGQQRLSGYLISGLPVFIALIMKFVSPGYFDQLLQPGTIRLLLVGAGAGIVIGFYCMMRIADIEV